MIYTWSELLKLHKTVLTRPPKNYRICKKIARSCKINVENQKKPRNNSKTSWHIPKTSHVPSRIKVSLLTLENLKFGEGLSIRLMFLEGNPVQHIKDTASNFSAATYLDSNAETYGQTVEGICLAFVQTWRTVYAGFLIDCDQVTARPSLQTGGNNLGM